MSAWEEIDEAAEKRLQASQETLQREYRFTLGSTEITCRRCGHTTVVENEELEAMREFRCPACDGGMHNYEFARMKAKYHLLLFYSFYKSFGVVPEYFDKNISINPHYEKRTDTEKELSGNE